jgi:photosystem II stability/assembly factor-like uncharacterized protein
MLEPNLETKMHKKQIQQTRLIAASGVLATLLFGCGGSTGSTAPAAQAPVFAARVKPVLSTTWSTALFGGGGYVTGTVYHPAVQGLAYIRTDVGGAYRRDPGSSTWIPLNDDLNRDDAQLAGLASLAVDPNDSQKLYLAAGMYIPTWGRTAAILRSSDRGNTWSRTELPIHLNGNWSGRGTGERLQVDPNKGSILFLGTIQDGLYKSTDAGVTWSQVPGFPTTGSTNFVLFDKSTGSAGSATGTIYVGMAATTGSTLYRSTDGGATWAGVPGGPAGLMPLQGSIGGGRLLMTYSNGNGPGGISNGAVYAFTPASATWTNITPVAPSTTWNFGYSGLGVDPRNPNTIVVSTFERWGGGDDLFKSTDGGATWTGLNAISTHAAPNNPWLLAYNSGSFAGKMGHWISDVDIDPFNSNNVIYNTGYGVWESNSLGGGTVAWSFNDSGIEETGLYSPLVSPSTGTAHLFSALGDVAGARYVTDFNSVAGYYSNPNNSNYSVDVADQNANVVARTTASGNSLQISSDNGVTWHQTASSPVVSGGDAGRVAVSTSGTTLLWVPGGQGAYYSANGGTSWTASSGYPVSGGVTSGNYFTPVADKAANAYFYTYDFSTGTILESANNGQTFSSIYSGLDVLPSYASHHQLASVPGTTRRDLWLATPNGLWHINGAGASPVQIPNIQAAYGVGFGMAAVGQTYPAVYISAKVNNVFGIYQSVDGGATWKRINDDKHQWAGGDYVTGDMRIYGRVYVGAGRGGVMVGTTP